MTSAEIMKAAASGLAEDFRVRWPDLVVEISNFKTGDHHHSSVDIRTAATLGDFIPTVAVTFWTDYISVGSRMANDGCEMFDWIDPEVFNRIIWCVKRKLDDALPATFHRRTQNAPGR